jgi:hypothetical protein
VDNYGKTSHVQFNALALQKRNSSVLLHKVAAERFCLFMVLGAHACRGGAQKLSQALAIYLVLR